MPALYESLPSRRGLTLIELLVVIVILVILSTLVAVYIVPSFSDNKNVIRAVDRITIALLTAKNRALRDGLRGIRFGVEAVSATPPAKPAAPVVSQIVYIQQADPYRVPSPPAALNPKVSTTRPPPPQAVLTRGSRTVTFQTPAGGVGGVDLIGGAPTDAAGNPLDYSETEIQPGDYFRYEVVAPSNYRIVSLKRTATGDTLRLATPFPLPNGKITNPPQTLTTNMYQIIRQPRPIAGEAPLDLPQNVVVDLATVGQYSPNNQVSTRFTTNPANAAGPAQTLGYWEIMFDPSGGVMATFGGTTGGGSTPIVLFVRDSTVDITNAASLFDPNIGRAITIYPRTGKIAASPIAPGAVVPYVAGSPNPFAYAIDGKSSGL